MRLRMMMVPPAVFPACGPRDVLSPEERAAALAGGHAAERLWLEAGRRLLEDNAFCMEANGGAAETLGCASRLGELSRMEVTRRGRGSYALALGGASLWLEEDGDGGVELRFLDPDGPEGGKEEWSLDLSGFGSGTSALFIAALFASWGRVSSYTVGKAGALPQ